jgi:putative phosphoribosyl transferase
MNGRKILPKGQSNNQVERFASLRSAGVALSRSVESYRNTDDLLVLGIALAGAPVAREVATHLSAPLDLIVIRRLFVPQPGEQLCAVNVAGKTVLDEGVEINSEPSTPVEHFVAEALSELAARAQTCRRDRPLVPIQDCTVMIVDCGIRTGLTIKAAAGAVRRLNPKKIIGAVPVASREGHAAVVDLFDEFVCGGIPDQFINAGFWYLDFSRPQDDQVGALLER